MLNRRAAAVALTMMTALPAHAWGEEGHQIVGALAMTRLTPAARSSIMMLLGNDDLATAGLWADQIRGDPVYDWAKPYHYVNLPRDGQEILLSRDCPTGECVVLAIPKFLAIAADITKPQEERAEALKFAVHFMGDLHQPLHAGYKDDLGGNRIQIVAFGGEKTNLHALWDSVLIRHKTAGEWRALATELSDAMQAGQVAEWQSNLNSEDWANESAAITRVIYKELPDDQKIDEAYYTKNIDTVKRRLSMGGVRMAAALNKAFALAPPAATPASGQVAPAAENRGQVAPAN